MGTESDEEFNRRMKEAYNPISNPNHYQFKEPCKEVRDVIRDRLQCIHDSERVYLVKPGVIAYDYANAIKYLLRWWDKNGLEDLLKAKYCLDSLIELFTEELEKSKKDQGTLP